MGWADQICMPSSYFLFLGAVTQWTDPQGLLSLFFNAFVGNFSNCFGSLYLFIAFWVNIISIPESTESVPPYVNPTIWSNMCPSFRQQAEQMLNSCHWTFLVKELLSPAFLPLFLPSRERRVDWTMPWRGGSLPLLSELILQTSCTWSGGHGRGFVISGSVFTSLGQDHRVGSKASFVGLWPGQLHGGPVLSLMFCCHYLEFFMFECGGPHFHFALRLTN